MRVNSPVAGRLGRFTIASELGRGAMGIVYQAVHPGLGVSVAIKVLSEVYSRDPDFRIRFQREAATIASLNHPGIVRVYDFDSDDGALFIVMEFVEGRSLRYWLGHSGRFRVDVGLDLIQQLLSAVGAAHFRGIIHRDLKPDNVLVSTQGKTKILDFGISKWIGEAHSLTATGAMVGTPAYMAPEQVRGEDIDQRADIYALGCILYELLHGEPPFVGAMPSVLHSQVFNPPRPSTAIPENLFAIIEKAMAKSPSERFQTCESFAGALLQATRPDQTIPTSPPADAPPAQTAGSLRTLLGTLSRRGPGAVNGKDAGGCTYGGCGATEGWSCAYVDAKGERCNSWWCKKHVVFMDAVPFCPRHSNVLRALSATAGTIREIKHRPEVSDRALPLADLVAADVDRDISELIQRRYRGQPGVHFGRDATIRQTWEGRGQVAWERSWSAHRNQGYVTRVAVRVSMAEPDTVKVAIGQTVIFSSVPDWISRRREGHPPDPADRARFRQHVVEAVVKHIDSPAPVTSSRPPAHPSTSRPGGSPLLDLALAEGMVLRVLANTSRMTAYEIAERLSVPYSSIEPALNSLTTGNSIDSLGIAPTTGTAAGRPLAERMAYAITTNGRARMDTLPGTRYAGAAPVSLSEFNGACRDAARRVVVSDERLASSLDGLEIEPGVLEAVRAAVNSGGSLFLYGPPGNGKTSLARRLARLLGEPILLPVAVDLGGGDVMRVFDPATHALADGAQPVDERWRRVQRPMLQVGGEFMLEMLEPTWEPGSRTYEAPLQVKAMGGVLLIDDLGRQRMPPKAILDRLLVPLEQRVDHLNITMAGRKVEVPFAAQVVLSTNLSPADLLDEAYLRRLAYKVLMPDPDWELWCRIFERERERAGIDPEPESLELIGALYGSRPMRGSHPRDLIDRLRGVALARGQEPRLTPELIQAAWQTLFVTR